MKKFKKDDNVDKSSKIIKGIYTFILLDIIVIGLLYIYQIYSLTQLKNEVKEFAYMDVTKDRYNSADVCFGSYRIVEDAIKDYLDDFAVNIQEASNLVTSDKFNNLLSYDNIEKDGPNFEESFTYLDNVSKTYDKKVEYLLSRLDEDTIKNFINSRTNNLYYRDLYKELMLEDNMLLDFYNTKDLLTSTQKEVYEYIENSKAVLTFLKEHPDSWILEDKEVKFKNHDDYNTYIELISKIK